MQELYPNFVKMPSAETRLMGILGKNLGHSLSPLLHNTSAAWLGVDISYLTFDIEAQNLEGFLRAAFDAGAHGFSVTSPHKKIVAGLRCVDASSPSGNTLVRGISGWRLEDTDVAGFLNAMKDRSFKIENFQKIIFLGNGAVAAALCSHVLMVLNFCGPIRILRRNSDKDAAFTRLGGGERQVACLDLCPKVLRSEIDAAKGQKILLVQASAAPHKGELFKEWIPSIDLFSGVYFDICYAPVSALYGELLSRGRDVIHGHEMLAHQAALQQQLWWGKSAAPHQLVSLLRKK